MKTEHGCSHAIASYVIASYVIASYVDVYVLPVAVVNPAPGGGVSNPLGLAVVSDKVAAVQAAARATLRSSDDAWLSSAAPVVADEGEVTRQLYLPVVTR